MLRAVPSYMEPISGKTMATSSDVAAKDVLALNSAMLNLYDNAARIFQKNFLGKHPVILALFSGAGGRMVLYRPGMAPTEAPQVPIVYQLLKSIGHSTMALAEVVGPYVDNADDKSWRGAMLAYRAKMQAAVDGLGQTPMESDWRDNNRTILQNNIAFMDECLNKGVIPFATLESPTCVVPAASFDGRAIRTVEGHASELTALQKAFIDHFAFQCGYCTAGFLNEAKVLLERLAKKPVRAPRSKKPLLRRSMGTSAAAPATSNITKRSAT
jgi:hypothetical protein